jgi:hypothetical protein
MPNGGKARILIQEMGYLVKCDICQAQKLIYSPHGALGLGGVVIAWNRRVPDVSKAC